MGWSTYQSPRSPPRPSSPTSELPLGVAPYYQLPAATPRLERHRTTPSPGLLE